MDFLNHAEMFRVKEKPIQFPKHWKSELLYYEESIGKRKYSKAIGFLQILREAKSHIIPKT